MTCTKKDGTKCDIAGCQNRHQIAIWQPNKVNFINVCEEHEELGNQWLQGLALSVLVRLRYLSRKVV